MADQTDAEIIAEAKARFARCQSWESTARDYAIQDARFANGDSRNNYQWTTDVLSARGDRPCLTMNKARVHNRHIINDNLKNKSAIKVTPTGDHATFEAAEVFSAIVRRIEYESKAMDAYATAFYHQVESGIGYVRVTTDYTDNKGFNQTILIKRVKDPRCIYLDPDADDYDKADMKFAFWFSHTPRKEFEAKYPNLNVDAAPSLDYADDTWDSKEHVMEAEYWRRGEKDDELHELMDGTVVRDSELPPGAKTMLQIKRSRAIAEPEIEWFQLAGGKIVDRKIWPGQYIPIVPFIGEETVIDGTMDRHGHTRALLDPQKMYNYWSSMAVEQVSQQSRSPYLAPGRAIEGYETYWNSANTVNHPYLPYNDIDDAGQPIRPPERTQPPQMAQAFIQGMQIAKDDMLQVTGQFQAALGQPGNEVSGVAIGQRQQQSETATANYNDNSAKAIRQIGRILVDLIPKIMDVAQVVKIMALDGKQSDVQLDPNAAAAHQHVMPGPPGQPPVPVSPEQAEQAQNDPDSPDPTVIFNPTVGRYSVEAESGPSYQTQREAAFSAFSDIVAKAPDLVHVAGDLLFKSADFPLADQLAERLKRGVPPQYLGGPSPQVQQLQQQLQQVTQHGATIAQQADAQVAHLQAEIASLKEQAKDKTGTVDNATYDAETRRLIAVANADPTLAKVIYRSMASQLLGVPALPVMHLHDAADAEHAASIAPDDPDAQTAPISNGAA
jgi:Phage P22-like portal protein